MLQNAKNKIWSTVEATGAGSFISHEYKIACLYKSTGHTLEDNIIFLRVASGTNIKIQMNGANTVIQISKLSNNKKDPFGQAEVLFILRLYIFPCIFTLGRHFH